MQQLTTLDAQFLAIESATTYGHVGGLAVYDPATAPGGELTLRDVCRLVGQRLHLLPPFRRRLVPVPLRPPRRQRTPGESVRTCVPNRVPACTR